MDGIERIDKAALLFHFKKSEACNLLAEIFLDELQYIMGEDVLDHVVVKNKGMNSRVQSKDILDAGIHNVYMLGELIELSLARNSIYHQLPEFLFHTLTLGEHNMTQREVVDAIKNNKKKEKEAIRFFSPFDTAFFKERVRVHKRYLNSFFAPSSHNNLNTLIISVIGKNLGLSSQEQYKLFYFLCKAEEYKEDLPRISFLLHEVLGQDVQLSYIPCIISDMPYAVLGDSVLSVDSGLSGEYEDETDDIGGTIFYHQFIPDMQTVENHIQVIKGILNFFILSKRKITLQYTLKNQVDFLLGENRLGFDTNL